ncbi:LysE family transporter [Micromonospora sp. M12]
MLTSAVAGFSISIALIVAIGAQNAFVLRQGLRREHVVPVVLTCAASDALLIMAGVAGVGTLVTARPGILTAIRWGGAAFLLCYAALAARRALRPGALLPTERPPATLGATLLACAAFTYLNPTSTWTPCCSSVGGPTAPAPLGLRGGAVLASAVWFTALGVGAQRLAPLLARAAAWRVLDAIIAVVMAGLALALLLG